MGKKSNIYPEKWLLMLSGIAFLLLIIPAWASGFLWGGAAAVVLCLSVWKLPLSRERVRGLLRPGYVMLAMVICSGLACNFYNTWLDSSYVGRIAALMGLEPGTLVLGLCVAGVLAAAPAASCVLCYFGTAAAADLQETGVRSRREPGKKYLRAGAAVLVLFAVYAVGISAILRANYLYRDDFGRVAFGYKQWDYFSRYLSTAMASLVHMGDYLVDISPMPQLLAMLILAVSGVLMLYIVYDRAEFTLWELAALVPLGLNPYFLECASYRFDAPYMAVSVLCGTLPLLFRRKNAAAYVFASIMGILLVCTGYQAAAGVYPMLVILLALRMLHRGEAFKETLLFCLKSVAGYGAGLVFFKLVIMRPADAGYVTNSLPALKELIPTTLNHLGEYYSLILSDFKFLWLLLAALVAAGFVGTQVCASKLKKLPALALTLLAVVLMGLLCFGIYPVLAETIFAPRAMYGFGILLTLFAISAAEGKGVPVKMPAVILAWAFFVFGFTYGNALNSQKEYTDFRINLVLEDINDLEIFRTEEDVTVQLSGDIGQAPVIRNMPQNYQMLNRLLPSTFGAGEDWAQYGFYYYYDLPNVVWDESVDLREMELPILKETMYHTIRGEGTYVLIELY